MFAKMNNSQILQSICGGIIGLLVFIMFGLMFGWAVAKGDFIFHYGRIRGKLARLIGVIGLLGITAGAYLAISYLVFDTQPPFVSLASFLFGIFFIVMIVVRFLSLFFWRSK